MVRRGMVWAGLAVLIVMALAPLAYAQDAGGEGKAGIGMGAGFSIGLAALGGGIGQGLTAGGMLLGISRNPGASGKMFVPMILGLVLIESLAIYALLISFQLVGKLGG